MESHNFDPPMCYFNKIIQKSLYFVCFHCYITQIFSSQNRFSEIILIHYNIFLFLMDTFFHFFKQISLLYHYLYIIMENKSNEDLKENQKKCSNFIKNNILFQLEIISNLF